MGGTTYGIKAGKAFVLIEAVDMTARVLDRIRNKLGRFGSDISALGATMAFRAAGALTPVAMSLKTFAGFDDSMRIVEARSKGSADEMQNLRNQAQELGATTAFTASHIGQLMARLAQFGKSRADIGKMTEPIMFLARAGASPEGHLEQDIINATDATTQMMAAFRLETTDTGRVVDLLATTVNNGRFTLEELSTALQYAAPTAHDFNISIEDMLTALVGIRELGYEASITGTAFRNMLNYVSQAKERVDFNDKLKELTGSTIRFTDAAGDLVNPLEMLVAIKDALKGVGNVEAADLITQLFEMRATGPARGLGQATETIARMRTLFKSTGGTAKRTHDAMEEGMGGAFRRIASAAENVAITIGKALNPAIVNLGIYIEASIHYVTDWMTAYGGWITMIVAGTVGVGLLGLSLVILGQSLRMLSGLIYLVTVPLNLLGFLFTPGGVLIAGLLALLLLLPQTQAALASAAASFMSSLNAMLASWKTTLGGVSEYLRTGDIQGAFELLAAQVELTWKTMLDNLMTAWEAFKNSPKIANPFMALDIKRREADIAIQRALGNPSHPSAPGVDQLKRMQDELQALRDTNQGYLDEAAAPHEARKKELDDMQKRLKLLQDSAEIYRQLQTEMASPYSSTPTPDFKLEMEKLMEGMKDLIMPGDVAGAATEGRQPLQGAEKGSVEAAQRFQENKFNAMNVALNKMIALAASSDKHLGGIEEKLAANSSAFVGV